MSNCVVRIRPAAQTNIGRSLEQALSIVQTLSPQDAAPSGFDVEFLLDIPRRFSEHEDMAEAIVQGAGAHDVIFVEANFPTRDIARAIKCSIP